MLYDETRLHLTSKFLKKEEIIRAGGSLRFDGYIVDIVDLKDPEPLKEINADRSNCSSQNIVQSKNHNEHPAGSFVYPCIRTVTTMKYAEYCRSEWPPTIHISYYYMEHKEFRIHFTPRGCLD